MALRPERAVLAVVLPALLAACSAEPEPPRWVQLAAAGSAELAPAARVSLTEANGRSIEVTTGEGEARLALELRAGDWESRMPGIWVSELPAWTQSLRGRAIHAALEALEQMEESSVPAAEDDPPYRLRDERGELQLWLAAGVKWLPELPARHFMVVHRRLFVNTGEEAPPARLALEVREERGPVEGGLRRFRGDSFAGDGLVVWPGERLDVEVELEPESSLHFGLVAEARLDPAFERGSERVYSIRLGAVTLFEERVPCGTTGVLWRSVPLPPRGGSARLSFAVQGPFAHTAFLSPTAGPLAQGSPGARPWGGARPHLVVFLADTFRADNLAAYGGRAELAPFLNELAGRSRTFTRAWSTATYTLAAHASLFTGLFPRQAGILDARSELPGELVTLAEFLARLGYRTGAVTDKGYVSQAFGLDQGFQFFDERAGSGTLAERVRAFVEADDGRPLFLFVQTYRTHKIYDASPGACAALGFERLSGQELADIEKEHLLLSKQAEPTPADQARLGELAAALEEQYRGTVWDLDRDFAQIFGELETRGYLGQGYLVFTSDHGEAFGEHGELYHSGDVHEEQVRVPLFVHGPGLTGERVDWPVSLVDVPATLGDLAGASPDPGWQGTSLVDLARERPVYAFQSHKRGKTGCSLFVLEGQRKVIGMEDPDELRAGSPRHAFDLAHDPGELRDLAGESWPRELFERHRAALDAALQPRVAPVTASPSAEELQDLQAMGYAGEDE